MTEQKLSHLNEQGEAHMVDISEKEITNRVAIAEGFVYMQPETFNILAKGDSQKGDVLASARIAGIMAAKKTHELIPLCHQLSLTKVTVDFKQIEDKSALQIISTVKTKGKTGVEMEALTAVTVSCLTIYDMLKAVDKTMTFNNIKLLQKTGGKSGEYQADL